MASAAPAIDLQAIPVEQLSPGLIATYRSVNAAATGRGHDVVRVEAKPALTIFQEQTANESLFPDFSPGAFEAGKGITEIRTGDSYIHAVTLGPRGPHGRRDRHRRRRQDARRRAGRADGLRRREGRDKS